MIMMILVIAAVIMMVVTVKLNLCDISYILYITEEYCRQCLNNGFESFNMFWEGASGYL